MRKFLRRLSIFIILLSFVFLGGGAIVSYIENGSILPETYLIGLSDSDVSISTVDNEGVKGLSSGKDTNDKNNNVNSNTNTNTNTNTNNIINNDNSNNNNNQNIDNNQTNEIPVDENVSVEEVPNTEIVDGTVPDEEVIIDENDMSNDFVGVGLKVEIKDVDSGEKREFTIVGSTEADPFAGKISNESLVGQHLLGKKKGEVVEIVVPDGVLHYKVENISR